jgi:DNA (cytosine-5)-methyltransferase 1
VPVVPCPADGPAAWGPLLQCAMQDLCLARAAARDMTCGDLFAGIGGMSLGLERAGFTVRWQVEREPYCETILARHWPAVVRRRDVRFAGAGNLERVDLIAGGFPCQDVSAAGRGAGLAGHRSGLWREFARIVGELRPRWVLVENVPALRRRGADIVLGDLEAAGYACWPLVVGARHVGAPHRRDRVWIVGGLADGADAGLPVEFSARRQDEGRPATADAQGARGRREDAQLADCDGYGFDRQRGGRLLDGERAALRDDADGCDRPGVADRDPARLHARGVAAGAILPAACGQVRWPARPCEPQHDWEMPRTVESPVGRAAHGVSARLARARWRHELKALGNAVVPEVVEVIGHAILAVESSDARRRLPQRSGPATTMPVFAP